MPGVAAPGETLTGLDVLEQENFAPLAGRHVGLITNQTGQDRQGHNTIDLLAHAPGVKLVALFSPEHSIRGSMDENVASSTDAATGLPIYSLYGETRRPTDEMLQGIDTLVYDIQDAGVRFYTFLSTMGYSMEAAARHHIAFYVLDRPDLLGGEAIEGPVLDRDKLNFVGYFPMPVRMGMTTGEMARMFNAENHIGCDLHVIECATGAAASGMKRQAFRGSPRRRISALSPQRFHIPASRFCKTRMFPRSRHGYAVRAFWRALDSRHRIR